MQGKLAFSPLKPEAMALIVEKFMKEVHTQLGERDVSLELKDDAIQYLATKGYDPDMGARPLARIIEDELKKPLTNASFYSVL